MLTAEHEAGFRKCHVYWDNHEYGPLKLKKLSETKVSLDIDTQPSGSRAAEHTSAAESGRRRANTTTAFEAPGASSPQASRSAQGGDSHYVIIRKFALSHAEHPFAPMREITHLHYPSWPDHGVPARASHVLALVELANVMQRASLPVETASSPVAAARKPGSALVAPWADEPESNPRVRPMLVHCSAGCGRTGAFCTVDSVIDMLKRQRLSKMKRYGGAQSEKSDGNADNDVAMEEAATSPHGDASPVSERSSGPNNPPSRRWSLQSASSRSTPDIPALDLSWVDDDCVDLIQATVEDFRTQRLSMVQSLRQYVLCYEAILEWVWRIQDRVGHGDGPSRGRARSGSLRE
jgi:protein-tyrosine phosphatase